MFRQPPVAIDDQVKKDEDLEKKRIDKIVEDDDTVESENGVGLA